MEAMGVTREQTGVLSREKLAQAAFGALCQDFALGIISRAGWQDGLYQQVALEFLEEPEAEPVPAAEPVLRIDLKLVLEALHKTGREDLIGYGKRCLIRPDKGQAPGAPRREEHSAPQGKKPAPGRSKKGPGDPRKERYSGRHSVEKQEQTGRPVRKAGWAKPKPKKNARPRKGGG